MYTDKRGLPVQADGDATDQLQRAGMIALGVVINGRNPREMTMLGMRCLQALDNELSVGDGIFKRNPDSDPNDVSCDQLVPVIALTTYLATKGKGLELFKAMMKRYGFAQNTRDTDPKKPGWKMPDFMLLRTASLFTRMSGWTAWLSYLTDWYLVVMALASAAPVWRDGAILPSKRSPDDSDDNNLIITLVTTNIVYPTFVSRLAARLYRAVRPYNYGCKSFDPAKMKEDKDYYHPIFGSLRWYHRGAGGGNPEVAELWKPIVDSVLNGMKGSSATWNGKR